MPRSAIDQATTSHVAEADNIQRTSFGDPDFLEEFGSTSSETDILSSNYAATIREKIIDGHTQNVSAYDPNGFEVQEG